jgi:hypothetical protein
LRTADRENARRLRAAGWSIKQIEAHLGAARSSVSLWVRDVPLDDDARARLVERARLGPLVAAERKAERARALRRLYQERGRQLVNERDGSYAAGCTLYWAEGAKRRNTVKLTNSDPELVSYFLAFLRRHFDVPDERVRIHCNLFADHLDRQREIENHWLDRLSLTRAALQKSTVNVFSKYSQKKRVNKLPYGTCALLVHSTEIVQTIYGSIQELGGFERPAWLD